MAAVEEILERLNEAGEAEPAQDDEDAWSDDDDAAAPPAAVEQPGTASAAAQPAPAAEAAAPAAGQGDAQDPNQLQRVVMSKRLAGLQSRQRELEVGRVFSINQAAAPMVGGRHGVHTGRMCIQLGLSTHLSACRPRCRAQRQRRHRQRRRRWPPRRTASRQAVRRQQWQQQRRRSWLRTMSSRR